MEKQRTLLVHFILLLIHFFVFSKIVNPPPKKKHKNMRKCTEIDQHLSNYTVQYCMCAVVCVCMGSCISV